MVHNTNNGVNDFTGRGFSNCFSPTVNKMRFQGADYVTSISKSNENN
jgi:hypothetical protein